MATEIVTMKVKESFNPEEMQKMLYFFKPPPNGLQSYRWGRVAADPYTVVFILNWDSVAHHEAFMKSPIYPTFSETVMSILTGPAGLSIYHTHLQPFPITKLFEAGNIEVASLTKRPEVSHEQFKEARSKLLDAISKAGGYESHYCGVKHEDNNVYIILIGWDSVDSHVAFASPRPDELAAIFSNIVLEDSSALDVKLHPE